MQVRVFEAPNMAAGLKQVKEALGPEALILSTRTLRKGKLGLLGKPMLEITAAVDERWSEAEAATSAAEPHPVLGSAQPSMSRQQASLSYENMSRSPEPPGVSRFQENPHAAPAGTLEDARQMRNELQQLRHLIQGLAGRIPPPSAAARACTDFDFVQRQNPKNSTATQPVLDMLLGLGVNRHAATTLNRLAKEELDQEHMTDAASLRDFLLGALSRVFKTTGSLTPKNGNQLRIALVGATGVGKTTTIAKLAAGSLARLGGNIALITIDTYRVAAVEQLKVYSEIMRLPLEVVIRPQELEGALARHRERDLIIIDTAGRSPRDGAAMQELAEFFPPHLNIEQHLVLPAPTRESELEDTISRFSMLPLASFLFTKLDECGNLGVLLNTQLRHDTPISYLTNGQRVPEDILTAEPGQLADMILRYDGACYHG